MDTAFIYYKPVTGKSNIGRRSEQTVIANLLEQGENIAIYEPAKTGKKSLMQQTFLNMRISGRNFSTAEVPMLQIRSTEEFLLALGSAVHVPVLFRNGHPSTSPFHVSALLTAVYPHR